MLEINFRYRRQKNQKTLDIYSDANNEMDLKASLQLDYIRKVM